MADSTTHLDTISSSQSSKEVAANALLDAASAAMLFGRRASTTAALTWGYYGGKYRKADGTILEAPNGTVALTASATNYLLETDGVVSKVTAVPAGWPGPLAGGAKALYAIVCNGSGVDPAAWPAGGYKDYRTQGIGSGGASGTAAAGVSITDTGGYFTGTDVEAALQEIGAVLGASPDAMVFRGVIDCSANPNYPAANAGDVYKVSVAGKIGGGSGPNVEAGDTLYCTADGTSAGTHAAVGASWVIVQSNVDGAVTGPASAADGGIVLFDGATGKVIKAGTLTQLLDLVGSAAQGDILYRNATEWVRLAAGSSGQALQTQGVGANPQWASQPLDVHTFYPGVPTASAKIYRGKVARAVTFPANFAGAQFTASVNATATTVFDIQKNGSSVGSCSIAAGGVTPTFSSSGGLAITLAAGDILAVIAPATPDATLADPAITLAGTR